MSKLVIGLTGGIGSGKTAVSERFAEKGIAIVDADIVARLVVQPGSEALAKIAEKFGPESLTADGLLNRPFIRQLVFADKANKQWIDALLHPLIRNILNLQTQQATSPYCILAVPLLVENGMNKMVDRVLVVDVDTHIQLQRASSRDGQTPEQVQRIIDNQASREDRLAVADDIIDNSQTPADLIPQIEQLHQQYLEMASIK